MARTYSVRFMQYEGPAGTMTYKVPAGKRAVVKFISSTYYAQPATTVYLYIAGHPVYLLANPAGNGSRAEELRLVAYAGETIALATASGTLAVHVSGYLFDDDGGALAEVAEFDDSEIAPGVVDEGPPRL